jgi:hypothetical protein
VSAPRPQLRDDSRVGGFIAPRTGQPMSTILTGVGPLCDAADAAWFGRYISVSQSSC